MGKRITAWSYSRWSDYEKCPQLAKFKHVDRMKEPENDAMKEGLKVHDDLASYLSSGGEVPERARKHFAELVAQLREFEPLHDQEWGYTSDWKVTGWFANNTWFRSKLDVCIVYDDNTADVVDFKTGKDSPTHAQQAELYTISVLIRYPQIVRVVVRFWYLDLGTESVYRYSKSDLAELMAKWKKRTLPMLSDEIFAPKPGRHCGYCAFAKSKDGPCKFG
jgi:hypothetical protein